MAESGWHTGVVLKLLQRNLGLMGLAAAATAAVLMVPTTVNAAPSSGTGSVDSVLNNVLDALVGNGDSHQAASTTTQLIVATGKSASDTTGTLTAYEKGTDGNWKIVVEPVKAFFGAQGQGEPKDNVPRTPSGTFALDQAFGRKPNPGTKMPYRQVTTKDWWDSDMKSPTYNTLVTKDRMPSREAENLYNMGAVYDYAVNIAHNPSRTPGKASAIFLHVTNNSPTEGCVAIPLDAMDAAALVDYAGVVGQLLAKGHARTSGASMIAGYMGGSERVDDALCVFARRYADQTEADHALLVAAVDSGRLAAERGI